MQLKIVFAALAVCVAPSAYAQSKPIYFVVDASGSMQGQNKDDAELLLHALSLPRDQLVSVTYFGRKPPTPDTNLCFETLVVPIPTPRGQNFPPQFPELGGKDDQTAITNAIDEVLGKIDGPAKLIVVTDGQERCNKNFSEIRARHPNSENVEIEVRQVGDSPNSELQKLEEPPISKPVVAPAAPTSPNDVDVHVTLPADDSKAWTEAPWYEQRLWFFAVLGLLVSAWFWGSSFGRRANDYENATKLIEQKRREILEKGEVSEEELAAALPEELDQDSIKRVGRPDAWRSVFACVVAVALGAPLILFEFAYPEWAKWGGSVVLFLALFGLLVFVTRKALPDADGVESKSWIKSVRAKPMTVIVGLAGIGLVVWACWLDLAKAKSAAWFVLSANLSAALAIAASAPLLFVGSRWWQFEMAKSTYQHTYTQAISDSIREKRRIDKRVRDEWAGFRLQHLSWKPEIEFTLFGLMAQLFAPKARKAREAVVEKLRSIAVTSGGASASPEGRARLENLLEGRSVATRIRALIADPATQEKMVPKDEWEELAEALDSNNDRRIATAYTKMANLLS